MSSYEKKIKKNMQKNEETPKPKSDMTKMIRIFLIIILIIIAVLLATYFIKK